MPVVGLEAWFTQIPPVTRTWLALSVLTSVAVVRPYLSCGQQNLMKTRLMTDFLHYLPLSPAAAVSHAAMSIGDAITTLLQL